MNKSFDCSNIRRVFALAFFFSFSVLFCGRAFSQTYVTNNGIIMERLADEDIKEVERLNEESEAEDARERERVRLEKQRLASEAQSQEDIEESDDIDELFGEGAEGDTENAISTPTTEIVKIDAKDKPVEFSGNLKAELGGYVTFYPWEQTKPLATFSNTLRFIGRPRTDFYVYGSFLTSFPQMDFGVYELYFDYTLFGVADISAGKRDLSWGHSRMLDTNILDDECSVITADQAVRKEDRTTSDSKFTFATTVPILSYGSIQFLAQYESQDLHTDTMADYISLAARIDGNIKNFSIGILGKRWAKADQTAYAPCVGLELISTILGKNSNLFLQGLAHISTESKKICRTRWSAGIYKYFENPIMFGFSFEYQGVWGSKEISSPIYESVLDDTGTAYKTMEVGKTIGQYKGYEHLFAAEVGWSRFLFTKKWTFGCKWFHDYRGEYGIVTPGITIDEVLPHVDFKSTAPIYYGSQEKYGLIFELVLNLKY